ncbi:hypothetical protein SAMN04488511_109199 [Pedobacter suwonensis]|uniref:Uncharacterized protein n=1 Tax=Pedobacter suwonensis TaxID=332999 RepID=A0A1I0TGI9_9SPHI|nr:S-4TM family putative pore-forming effector [Pedobacter suwonensis]SFA50875.1 hypothetical protein SAMN04488511_109199 [Pedobacter suwonensis]
MNNGNQILTAQNLDINIDKLLAQRRLYSNAKILQYFLLLMTILVPIFLSIITNFTALIINEKGWIYVTYSIIVLIFEKMVESIIDRHKKIAASIQEKFDIDVLGVIENETLNLVPIDFDIIRSNSIKDKLDPHKVLKVTNWYSTKIGLLQTNVAILFCQRMNICYDFSIKRKYNNYLVVISILTFSCLLVFSLLNNFSMQKFIVEVIFPSLPIFVFTYKEISTNLESIDNLQKLKEIIEKELDQADLQNDIDIEKIRRIQDRIYNNRILSPLIPNFIYNILWTRLEDEMNYSVENRIIELQ